MNVETLNIDLMCLKEAAYLARRSVKYWHLVGKLYLESIMNPHSARVFRAAYFFCRHIDDVLDDDRVISSDPEAYVHDILNAMKKGYKGPPIVDLYNFAINHIQKMANDSDDPESYFVRVIEDAMLFDYNRAKDSRILTRNEIETYYEDTFVPVTDLALIIAGSKLRTDQIPEIVTAQGHIFTIRDMKKDLEKGIINIPHEELEKAGVTGESLYYGTVRQNSSLVSWMDDEVETYRSELNVLKEKLSDVGSRKVCLPLILQMSIYCRLYQSGLFR